MIDSQSTPIWEYFLTGYAICTLEQLSETRFLEKEARFMGKMGKITIFPKLKELECSFLFLSPIFHPTESIYNSFKHSRLLVTPESGPRGGQNGPKTTQNG